jgi:hypothetical protein
MSAVRKFRWAASVHRRHVFGCASDRLIPTGSEIGQPSIFTEAMNPEAFFG